MTSLLSTSAPEGLSNTSETLPVVETFHSVQGEGYWTGTNAFFIRLAGCDVGCSWCDTKHSWNARRHAKQSVSNLVAQAEAANPRIVVITGGEPFIKCQARWRRDDRGVGGN
jgi:7-carboxy-7-deazaguanine synthase